MDIIAILLGLTLMAMGGKNLHRNPFNGLEWLSLGFLYVFLGGCWWNLFFDARKDTGFGMSALCATVFVLLLSVIPLGLKLIKIPYFVSLIGIGIFIVSHMNYH